MTSVYNNLQIVLKLLKTKIQERKCYKLSSDGEPRSQMFRKCYKLLVEEETEDAGRLAEEDRLLGLHTS